jgi:hypothetical protein
MTAINKQLYNLFINACLISCSHITWSELRSVLLLCTTKHIKVHVAFFSYRFFSYRKPIADAVSWSHVALNLFRHISACNAWNIYNVRRDFSTNINFFRKVVIRKTTYCWRPTNHVLVTHVGKSRDGVQHSSAAAVTDFLSSNPG